MKKLVSFLVSVILCMSALILSGCQSGGLPGVDGGDGGEITIEDNEAIRAIYSSIKACNVPTVSC